MENLELVNQRIAKNLTYYRKASGMTQAEVAEKISYSDKSVSKWESGNGVPDIYVLIQLASLFNVTVNDLVGNSEQSPLKENKKKRNVLHLLTMLLSCGIVWLVATIVFVTSNLVAKGSPGWLAFVYAVPVTAILLIVFSAIWKFKLLNFLSISGLVWTLLLAIYLTVKTLGGPEEYWLLFLLGIPLQGLTILWAYFRYMLVRFKETSMRFLRLKGRKNKRRFANKENSTIEHKEDAEE
ncbi:MAG: helix-turn-helix transcriptional regulator [Clostridia bacterium]|nr:helix-turn-helix transcriptional regulator [Clostridia bacterium]